MKRMGKQCLVGLWVCTILCGSVQAQDGNGGTARVSDQPGPLPPVAETVVEGPPSGYFAVTPVDTIFAPRAYFTARAGELYGYEESYTNVGAFMPYLFEEDALLFLDAGGLVTYDGRGGANVGLGWRYYMRDIQRIFGASVWYDFDGGHIRSYNQVGLSLESLGVYFDWRVNGYIPVGTNTNVITSGLTGSMAFSGNRLLVERASQVETAFAGFDTEVGGPMPIFGRYGLNGYVGFYFYTGQDAGDFTGVSGRLTWQVNEDANIGVQITDDADFGTNTQLQISMFLPDGHAGRWLRPLSMRDRMMQRVIRNNRVTVESEIKLANELGINPKDNNPYFIVHVDPNGATDVAEGDGSVANPFNLISQFDNLPFNVKSDVDIVLVQPRTDNTSTNLDTGVTLLSMQRLLGSTLGQTFQVAQQPGVDIPIFGIVQTGTLPTLSNRNGGDVVTFADGAMMVEVSGFNINGSATGSGIVGTNNQMVSINRNVITGGLDGIRLFNLTGLAADGMQSSITQNIIRGNADDGIFIGNAGAAPLDLIIANNPPLNVDLDGALVDTNNDGVPDATTPESLDGDGNFANDGIANNGGDGVDIRADAGSIITLVFNENRVFENGDNGLRLDATANGIIRGLIFSNEIHDNIDNGILMTANNGTIDFFNALPGVFDPVTGDPVIGQIVGNQIYGNGDDGLEVNAAASNLSFAIQSNQFGVPTIAGSGNGGFGVNITADGGTALLLIGGDDVSEGNTFFTNEAGGICLNLLGNNLTTLSIDNNTVVVPISIDDLIRIGFDQFSLAANDDGSTGAVPIGFNLDFFGVNFNQLFVNNNGNVSFGGPDGNFTPDVLNLATTLPTIAPFYADVDTRAGNLVTYGTGTVNGHNAFGVNWTDVRHFSVFGANQGLPTNSFQLVLIDRSDISPGDFDIEFNYEQIQWDTGEASGGNPQGLFAQPNVIPGVFSPARAGYTNSLNTSFELPGSGVPNAFLDNGPAATSLVNNSLNSNVPGRYVFFARNGNVINQPTVGDQDGIKIQVSGLATLSNSVIQRNTVTGQSGYGLVVDTAGGGSVSNLTVQNNNFSSNGGGILLNRDGFSTLDINLLNNTVTQNLNNGLELVTAGTAVNGVTLTMQDNLFDANTIDGFHIFAGGSTQVDITSTRDRYTNNRDDGIDITTVDNSTINFDLIDPIITGNVDDGISTTIGGTGELNLNIISSNGATTISGNGGAGFNIGTIESGIAVVNFDNMLFTGNGDGLAFDRQGASLILATITNSEITDNADDGIDFNAEGSDVEDPNTPLFDINTGMAPPSRLILNNVIVDDNGTLGAPNGGNGIEVHTDADANVVFNISNSSISNNATDGLRIFSGGQSSFGNIFTGERSTLDNVTVNNNGRDGMKLYAMGQFDGTPTQLVSVTSITGVTTFSDNGDDGIEATMPYGTIDLVVAGRAGGAFTTLFQRNGGNGIEFNVADNPIDGDDASDVPGSNARVDGDADGAGNEILDFYFPNGWEIDHSQTQGLFSGIGRLSITNVLLGDENINDIVDNGNAGNGLFVYNANISAFTGAYFAGGTVANGPANPGNLFDANRDLVADTVGGVGGSIINSTFLPTGLAGFAEVTVDNSWMTGNGIDGSQFQSDGQHVFGQTGNIMNVTVTNSYIAANGRHGVNIDLTGINGETNAAQIVGFIGGVPDDYTVLTTNQFIFDNNVIERNNNYGFRFQSNAGAILRPQFTTNADPNFAYFWGTFLSDPQPTNPPGEYDPINVTTGPLSPIFNSTLLGFFPVFNPNFDFTTALNSDFYSIATDTNSNLIFTNNIVQFNGRPGQGFDFGPNGGGDGMFIRVSTDSYLSVDIGGAAGSGNGNVFTGNALADLRIESFTATSADGVTPMVPLPAVARGAPALDTVWLDDTAQMTLRFNNNVGRELDSNFIVVGAGATVGQRGAAYHLNSTPFIGGANRLRTTQMFQVDDGFNLNTTNTFNTDLPTEFNVFGGYHLVPVADPAFPNPIFPQNWFQDPGDPYFPL